MILNRSCRQIRSSPCTKFNGNSRCRSSLMHRPRLWSAASPFLDHRCPIWKQEIQRSFHESTTSTTTTTSNNNESSMRLYDSLSETVQALPEDSSEKALAWYTCGPTTYAPAHMGHARTYVCLDILRRVMEAHMPKAPLFVMNITDVDDKILAAAKEQKIAPIDLARRFEADFWKDLDALHCLRPHVVTRVTEYVESDIVPYIERLVDQGMAYEAEDGVYFHVRAYNERLGHITKYGKLAPPAASQDIDITAKDDKSSTTTPVMKHDPRDFVLWKKRKPDEAMAWPSPWGEGRPGWHIECSAMIEAIQIKFQDTHQFLVHAGGVDLKFPHHTNEIAQAEAYGAKEWIPHWVHTGHVHIDGLKMSKSLKNFVSIQEFLTKVDSASALESPADDFRLWCLGLSGSYRGPATFSRDRIAEARSIRQKLLRFLIEGEEWISGSQTATKIWNDEEQELFLASENARERGIEALMNDMDGSTFVDELVQVAELGNTYLSQNDRGPIEPLKAAISNLRDLLSLVGFSEKTTRAGLGLSEQGAKSSHSLGDERAVIDAMVHFRSAVRHAALEDAKGKTASPNMKKILRLCDDTRNSILPKLGIELRDSNTEEGDGWRICLPRSDESQTSNREHQKSPSMDLESTPLEDFFRVGQYEGMFSEFNEDGIPIINADGFEVSKRMLKKLLKKREAHKRRLE